MTNDFCPVPWLEDPTPKNEIGCKKCGLYEHGSRMIWGEGNPNASIMIILDNPGERETKKGKTYVCGTRKTLQKAAHEVGLSESHLYVTYILKRRPKRAYKKEVARSICMQQHLTDQLKQIQPSFIFCLGNVAVQSFFESSNADVKTLRGQTHLIKGFQTIVAYHPLAVRRRPNLWSSFKEDWEYLAALYRKKL